MRRLKRVLLLAAPMAGVVALMVPSSTQAATTVAGEVTVTGSGNIAPGLNNTKRAQSVSFTGFVSGSFTANTNNVVFANVSCTFSGNGNDRLSNGSGSVTGTCGGGTILLNGSPAGGSAGCTLAYNREGTTVLVSGPCSASSGTVTTSFCATGVFEFVPNPPPTPNDPITSYRLAGSVTITPPASPCPAVPKGPKVP